MGYDQLKDAALPRAVSDVFADLADLVQKEIALARTELTEKLSLKVHAGIWMAVAGVLGLVAALLVVQALVFGIASYGIALHWSCLIVAAVIALAGAAAYFKGRSDARVQLAPTRTIHQVHEDIRTIKEQVT